MFFSATIFDRVYEHYRSEAWDDEEYLEDLLENFRRLKEEGFDPGLVCDDDEEEENRLYIQYSWKATEKEKIKMCMQSASKAIEELENNIFFSDPIFVPEVNTVDEAEAFAKQMWKLHEEMESLMENYKKDFIKIKRDAFAKAQKLLNNLSPSEIAASKEKTLIFDTEYVRVINEGMKELDERYELE